MALRGLPPESPLLETNGGFGRLYERAYYDRPHGVVLEKDEPKAAHLSRQRPTWRVYCCDSAAALEAGIANDLAFGFIDLDPYGSPFDILDAIFTPSRLLADRLQLVVNDGMRNKTRMRGEWHVRALRPVVEKYGVGICARYIECARELVEAIVARSGFKVTRWIGWYAGARQDMTHYWASLER